jgi:hypothetical protein
VIGLDTIVLARYFVEEAVADSATAAQRQAARQLIESGQELFLPKTGRIWSRRWLGCGPASISPTLCITPVAATAR